MHFSSSRILTDRRGDGCGRVARPGGVRLSAAHRTEAADASVDETAPVLIVDTFIILLYTSLLFSQLLHIFATTLCSTYLSWSSRLLPWVKVTVQQCEGHCAAL